MMWARRCIVSVAGAVALCAPMLLYAQKFATLYNFDITHGQNPQGTLVQGTDGNFYGTTLNGGANGGGTVFKITPRGGLTTLHNFCSLSGCADGKNPWVGLVLATDGNFYGTTANGGVNGGGTIFKITPGGTLTTLYNFCSQSFCVDGTVPVAVLVQAADGDFYGTTVLGGANESGTVFRITPHGTLTTLYSFCSQYACTDGSSPYAGLVQDTDGDLYGTARNGGLGASPAGTFFKINSSGTLSTLYTFCPVVCTDGSYPYAGLVRSRHGDFYGTTYQGGSNGTNDGTVFRITPEGNITSLYSFCSQSGCADGYFPYAGLIQATDGYFYGTTLFGGTGGQESGTAFRIDPDGKLTTLYKFCAQSACADGTNPEAALFQATNGIFYGTAGTGGANGYGTVFSLSVGLGPFVATLPEFGAPGTVINILGSDLTGATSVQFNGSPAAFTVLSASLLRATVPAGATTGEVQVVTPGGTLSSNGAFRVP